MTEVTMTVRTGGVGEGPWRGSYAVRPGAAAQVLPTARHYMLSDLTVEAIPLREEPNGAGTAVYIGEEAADGN